MFSNSNYDQNINHIRLTVLSRDLHPAFANESLSLSVKTSLSCHEGSRAVSRRYTTRRSSLLAKSKRALTRLARLLNMTTTGPTALHLYLWQLSDVLWVMVECSLSPVSRFVFLHECFQARCFWGSAFLARPRVVNWPQGCNLVLILQSGQQMQECFTDSRPSSEQVSKACKACRSAATALKLVTAEGPVNCALH